MSSQLLLSDGQSAACSQSTSSGVSSSTSGSFSSVSSLSPSGSNSSGSVGYCDNDTEWRRSSTSRRRRGRRGGRRQGSAGTVEVVKKRVKNAREKERVRIVRQEYDKLGTVLGGHVDRGTGHFSKVRTLKGAIRIIQDLLNERNRLLASRYSSGEAITSSPSTSLDVQLEVRSQ